MVGVIIGIITSILCMLFAIFEECKIVSIAVFILTSCYFIIVGSIIQEETSIDPIEVYRGNTKLKITEKRVDGQIVERDSIVILK